MPRPRWSRDEIATLRKMHAVGRTRREIAEVIPRRPQAIGAKAIRLGLTQQPRSKITHGLRKQMQDARDAGVLMKVIAWQFGVSRAFVKNHTIEPPKQLKQRTYISVTAEARTRVDREAARLGMKVNTLITQLLEEALDARSSEETKNG